MGKYGLELFNAQGKKTLSISDRLGRFLGSFTVPAVYQGETRRFVFPIPAEKQGLGGLFLVFNPEYRSTIDPYDTFFMCDTNINVYISRGVEVVAEISIENLRYEQDKLYVPSFKILYGVF